MPIRERGRRAAAITSYNMSLDGITRICLKAYNSEVLCKVII